MGNRIFIFGGGGHAKTVISLLRTLKWDIEGIVDDHLPVGTMLSGVPVIGHADILPKLKEDGITSAVNTVGGIGNYSIRWAIFERLMDLGFDFPPLIHPTAFVEDSVTIEDGVQILAQCYVSSEGKIGFGTLINAGCILGHDDHIGRCVNLSSGTILAGCVTVEDFAQLGMGVVVNCGVTIGTRARVASNATIKSSVPADKRIYAGCVWPAPHIHSEAEHHGGNVRLA